MTQGRCEACKLLSVCDIRDEGIVLHSDARTLLQNAAARDFVTADDRACDVCTTIWDSFQPDGLSRLLLDEISRGNVEVRLYRCTSKRMRDEKKYLRSRTLPSNEVDPVIQIAILLVPRTLSADLLRSGCVDENDYFFRFCGYIDWNEVWAFQKSPPSPGSKYANSYIWVYCGPVSETGVQMQPGQFSLRIPEGNSGSPASTALITQWLADCSQNHGVICPQNLMVNLPTRCIDVGIDDDSEYADGRCRLVTTAGSCGTYTALSYCWGSNSFFKLTSDNKTSLENRVPLKELPATIQDAIVLTRRLGMRYIWVDCLCIIQGNDTVAVQDWEHESVRMASVYGGARLTIAAISGDDCHSGLFQEPQCHYSLPQPLTPSLMRVPSTRGPAVKATKDNRSSDVCYLEHFCFKSSKELKSLNGRGWTFQEAALSSRIVSFGVFGLGWMCATCSRREHSLESRRPGDWPVKGSSEKDRALHILQNWTRLVEKYSERKLTFAKDKLTAVSGLANIVLSSLPGQKYHHGIWEDKIPRMLLWYVRPATNSAPKKARDPRRTPSWSWASVDSAVVFGERLLHHDFRLTRIKGQSIFCTAILQKIDRIHPAYIQSRRLKRKPPQQPAYRYGLHVRFIVDGMDYIPLKHYKPASVLDSDMPFEFLDICFLFVGNESGLILVRAEKPPDDDEPNNERSNEALAPDGTFLRIGYFEAYDPAKGGDVAKRRIELI